MRCSYRRSFLHWIRKWSETKLFWGDGVVHFCSISSSLENKILRILKVLNSLPLLLAPVIRFENHPIKNDPIISWERSIFLRLNLNTCFRGFRRHDSKVGHNKKTVRSGYKPYKIQKNFQEHLVSLQ